MCLCIVTTWFKSLWVYRLLHILILLKSHYWGPWQQAYHTNYIITASRIYWQLFNFLDTVHLKERLVFRAVLCTMVSFVHGQGVELASFPCSLASGLRQMAGRTKRTFAPGRVAGSGQSGDPNVKTKR